MYHIYGTIELRMIYMNEGVEQLCFQRQTKQALNMLSVTYMALQ